MKQFILIIGVIIIMSINGCENNKTFTDEFSTTTQNTSEETTTTIQTSTEQTTTITTTESFVGENIEYINANGHTIVHKSDELKQGVLQDLNYDLGILKIKDGLLSGTYTSPEINTDSFYELVGSWNAITPSKSSVELKVQVRQNDEWSQWFTYGKWGFGKLNGSISYQSDDIARMSIDTIIVKNGLADAYKYSITLTRKEIEDDSPQLKLVAATLKLSEDVVNTIDLTDINWNKDVNVPVHSQMIVPVIGNIICSPTSLTMLLNHYGIDYNPSDTAQKAKDIGANIYGNWSYNVAVAGALGLDAYVSRLSSIDELKLLISQEIPVAVSITVKDSSQLDGLPEKSDGTSMTYPGGHLLVVRGFTLIDGIEYVIVNDPAARSDEEVNRLYKLDQFVNIWKNYVYVVLNES